jgi:hypothetical protein
MKSPLPLGGNYAVIGGGAHNHKPGAGIHTKPTQRELMVASSTAPHRAEGEEK